MLLVTGPVSRNMEFALRKSYDATPEPRLVVAVGACGCTGGIFAQNYASLGGVDKVIPVDVYVPGCPPNPHALLHGILIATGRLQPAWEGERPREPTLVLHRPRHRRVKPLIGPRAVPARSALHGSRMV